MNPSDESLQCQKHKQKIIQIVLDNNCLPDDRMLCVECIESSRQPYNRVIGLAQAKEMIKEKILEQNAQIQEKSEPYLAKLTSFLWNMITFRESQIQIIDKIIGILQKWISNINCSIKSYELIELQKGLELLQQGQKELTWKGLSNKTLFLIQKIIEDERNLRIKIRINQLFLTTEYALNRICFINENELIVQQNGRGYSNIFRIKDKQLQEQQDMKIKLTDLPGDDYCLFPTIYNMRNYVIIQKSSNYVYIIKRDANGQFKVQSEPIDCETHFNYGSMTEDGKFLIIWNDKTKQFRLYKLDYE